MAFASWDQRETLLPPPYAGAFKDQVSGLCVGDPAVDALPVSAITCHGGERRTLDLGPDPEWVDWDSCARGQHVWMERLGQYSVGLTLALLQGFSIARFAVVLHASGYAQTPETSYDRYRDTAFAIIDWMKYDLQDKESQSRKAIMNVRAMHSFARRRSQRLFKPEEGVALSQYDMAEVQMAFAAVAPIIAEREMKCAPLTYRQKRDLCHTWRVVGYFLGIQDRYNVCASLHTMNDLVEDWLLWVPRRLQTCRPVTFDLQRAAIAGFGQYTGAGSEFFWGLLHASCSNSDFELDYLQQPALTGLKGFGRSALTVMGYAPVNWVAGKAFARMRDEFETNPQRQAKMKPVLSAVGRVQDTLVWRVVGLLSYANEGPHLKLLLGLIVARRLLVQARRMVMAL